MPVDIINSLGLGMTPWVVGGLVLAITVIMAPLLGRWRWIVVLTASLALSASPWPVLAIVPAGGLLSRRVGQRLSRRNKSAKTPAAAHGTLQPQTAQRPGVRPPHVPQPASDASIVARPPAVVIQELAQMTGMAAVKEKVAAIHARLHVDTLRRAQNYPSREQVGLNLILTGNPGVGKTSVARMLAEILASMGALPTANLVECSRADLVGRYVGETEFKTTAMIERAMGGTLFVDEAHTLFSPSGSNDFGRDALGVLNRVMENARGRFAVLLAGYPLEMQRLLDSDPGLRGRFADIIHFPDFSAADLARIFRDMARADGFGWSEEADRYLAAFCIELDEYRGSPAFANARLMRKLLDHARNAHAIRHVQPSRTNLPRDLGRLERPDILSAAGTLRQELGRAARD